MCFGACLLRPCTWSESQKITRSRTYNAPGAGFCFGLDYGQQTGGRQNASFETLIPWIALALLGYIGGKMLLDGIRGEEAEEAAQLSAGALFMQGIATSIDALSVGFTISEYGWLMALTAAIIIAVVTFILCMAGLRIGKKFGTQLSGKASILGGVILIGIGLEIFITGVF